MDNMFTRGQFRKSKFSNPNANCVEVAQRPGLVEVRDSKTGFGSAADARLRMSPTTFTTFLVVVAGPAE